MKIPAISFKLAARLLPLGLIALAPILMGAYYNSCGMWTVGMYPNYPTIPDSSGGHGPALESEGLNMMAPAHVHAVTLYVPWVSNWYDPTKAGCTLYPAASPLSVQTYVNTFLQKWNAPADAGGKELNLHVVFAVHVGPTLRVGPTCLGNIAIENAAPAFEPFLDATMTILNSAPYKAMARTIAIGNEVDLYLQSACSGMPAAPACANGSCGTYATFGTFFTAAHNYVTQKYSTLSGVTTTWFKMWNPGPGAGAGTWRNTCFTTEVATLHAKGDIVFLTYYPLDDNGMPLSPSLVSQHLTGMAAYNMWVEQFVGSQPPMVLQEVGYPTSPSLFLSTDDPHFEQTQFIQQFFSAWKTNNSKIQAALWWSLFDYQSTDCNNSPFAGLSPNLKAAFCSMGLFDSNGNKKYERANSTVSSWDQFATSAQAVESWQ